MKELKIESLFCLFEGASGGIEPEPRIEEKIPDICYAQGGGSPTRPTKKIAP